MKRIGLYAGITLLVSSVIVWFYIPYLQAQELDSIIKIAKEKIRYTSRSKKSELDLTEPYPATAHWFNPADSTHSGSDVLWTFSDDVPRAFAGKNIVLDRHGEYCFTDIGNSELCTYITSAQMGQIKNIRQAYKDSVRFREKQRRQELSIADNQACDNWLANLPEDYALFLIRPGDRKKNDLGYQIKGSRAGGTSELIEVEVNYPKKPVVLIMQNYYPTVWRISYAPSTEIAAVWATGYHQQVPIGVEEDTPVLSTTYETPRCKRHIKSTVSMPRVKVKAIEQPVVNSKVRIGRYSDRWISHGNLASLKRDPKTARLNGELGVKQLLSEGAIRPLTYAQFAQIKKMQGEEYEINPKSANKPMESHYAIQKPFIFPEHMYGAYSKSFYLLDDTIPFPKGDIGHNSVTTAFGYCVGSCP